jgi:hypothetical protein
MMTNKTWLEFGFGLLTEDFLDAGFFSTANSTDFSAVFVRREVLGETNG